MKKATIFLLGLIITACSPRLLPIPGGAVPYDLLSGKALDARKAAGADGIFASWHDGGQSVSIVRYDPRRMRTDIVSAPGNAADSVSALCVRNGALAGINGSYFDMRAMTPMTFVKDEGIVVGETSPSEQFRTNGIVALSGKKTGVDQADSTVVHDAWREVMAGGPILIDGGRTLDYAEGIPQPDSFFERRHPRSVVGLDGIGYVWLVVVDGRMPGEAEGMTISELTSFCLQLGLTDALNLDGGGSSTLWTKSAGVINHPCDNRRFDHEGQRRVPNALIVHRDYGNILK